MGDSAFFSPKLSEQEKQKIRPLFNDLKGFENLLRVDEPVGTEKGNFFCGLESLRPDYFLCKISVGIREDGSIGGISLRYTNGSKMEYGSLVETTVSSFSSDLVEGSRRIIRSIRIETGIPEGDPQRAERVTCLIFSSTDGEFRVQASNWQPPDDVTHRGQRGIIMYTDIHTQLLDVSVTWKANGYLKGFAGWENYNSIHRLSPIWGTVKSDHAVKRLTPWLNPNSQQKIFAENWYSNNDAGNTKRRHGVLNHDTYSIDSLKPRLFFGIRSIKTSQAQNNLHIRLSVEQNTAHQSDLFIDGMKDGFNVEGCWIAIPHSYTNFETGLCDIQCRSNEDNARYFGTQQVQFKEIFEKPPTIVLWLAGIQINSNKFEDFRIIAEKVSSAGFSIRVEDLSGGKVLSSSVSWLAMVEDENGDYNKNLAGSFELPTGVYEGHHPCIPKSRSWFPPPVKPGQTRIFAGITGLQFGSNSTSTNGELGCVVGAVTKEQIGFGFATGGRSMKYASANWVSFKEVIYGGIVSLTNSL